LVTSKKVDVVGEENESSEKEERGSRVYWKVHRRTKATERRLSHPQKKKGKSKKVLGLGHEARTELQTD